MQKNPDQIAKTLTTNLRLGAHAVDLRVAPTAEAGACLLNDVVTEISEADSGLTPATLLRRMSVLGRRAGTGTRFRNTRGRLSWRIQQ